MMRYILSGNPEEDLNTIQSIYNKTINSGDYKLLAQTALIYLDMYEQQFNTPVREDVGYIRYTIDVVNKTHDIKLLKNNLTKVYYILNDALNDKLKIKQDKQEAIRNSLDYRIRAIKTKPITTHTKDDDRGFEVWDVDEQRVEKDRKKKSDKLKTKLKTCRCKK